MSLNLSRALLFVSLSSFCLSATAAYSAEHKKDTYTLFNPTPVSQMRDMSTDRPDQTESPYTVDAGHFQIEMDTVNFASDHNRANGENKITRTLAFGNVNVKVGLTNTMDLQFVANPLLTSETEDRMVPVTTKTTGLGDLTTRLKVNLFGNDDGKTALAIMPYIKCPLPASILRNGKTEYGVILPFSMELTDTLSWGSMGQLDWVYQDDNSYATKLFVTSTLGMALSEQWGAYGELAARFSPVSDWQLQFDMGTTYALSHGLQWDMGANIGLTPEAPDLVVFSGLSWRM